MTLIKILLIDCALILLGFPLFLIFQRRKKESYILGTNDREKSLAQTSVSIPKLKELLAFEKLAKKEGSEIEFDSLIGCWKFLSVWKKRTDQEDSISSSLLRVFNARLELQRQTVNQELLKFDITNSIQFGTLSIKFIGKGELKGRQPLLPFFFECIELHLGEKLLFRRILDIPDEENRPFFSLIAMKDDGKWLSARGRAGGLALWLKE